MNKKASGFIWKSFLYHKKKHNLCDFFKKKLNLLKQKYYEEMSIAIFFSSIVRLCSFSEDQSETIY